MNFLKEKNLQNKDRMIMEKFDGFFTISFSRRSDRLIFGDGTDKIHLDGSSSVADRIANLLVETSRGCLDGFTVEQPKPNRTVYIFHGKEEENESETLQKTVEETEGKSGWLAAFGSPKTGRAHLAVRVF